MKGERISVMAVVMWEIIAIALFITTLLLTLFILEPRTWVWYLVVGLEGAIAIFATLLYIPFLYLNTCFYVNENAVVLEKGVFFRSTQMLYRKTIVFVTIYRNPLTPLLHVSTIKITATGGSMTILFLNSIRAKKLADELIKNKLN